MFLTAGYAAYSLRPRFREPGVIPGIAPWPTSGYVGRMLRLLREPCPVDFRIDDKQSGTNRTTPELRATLTSALAPRPTADFDRREHLRLDGRRSSQTAPTAGH